MSWIRSLLRRRSTPTAGRFLGGGVADATGRGVPASPPAASGRPGAPVLWIESRDGSRHHVDPQSRDGRALLAIAAALVRRH